MNTKGWVFPDLDERNPVPRIECDWTELCTVPCPNLLARPIRQRAKFHSRAISLPAGVERRRRAELDRLGLFAAVVSTPESVDVFCQMRNAPRLDLNDAEQWRARPKRELGRHKRQATYGFGVRELP